jgi:hypothetical protein
VIDKSSNYRKTPHKASVDLDSEGVILDLDSGIYYGLEGIGQRIWELLDEPISQADLLVRLKGEYDVGEDILSKDVEQFLKQLLENELIECDD